MLCKRVIIEGHTSYSIQGVNLREEIEKFVRRTINHDKIQVTDNLSNLKNGQVEIIFCGPANELNRIKAQIEKLTTIKKDQEVATAIRQITEYGYETPIFTDFTIERSDDLSEMVWALKGAGYRFIESTEVLGNIYSKIQERDEQTELSRLLALHYELVYNLSHLHDIKDYGKISLVVLNASIESPILPENDFILPLSSVVFALSELKNAESPLLNNFNTDDIKHDIESLDNKIHILLQERYNVHLQS
jgi:acylphosphatase/predicted metal-dependent hydrolase